MIHTWRISNTTFDIRQSTPTLPRRDSIITVSYLNHLNKSLSIIVDANQENISVTRISVQRVGTTYGFSSSH